MLSVIRRQSEITDDFQQKSNVIRIKLKKKWLRVPCVGHWNNSYPANELWIGGSGLGKERA